LADLRFAYPALLPERQRVVAALRPAQAALVPVGQVPRVIAEVAPVEEASVGVLHLLQARERAADQALGDGDPGLPGLVERDQSGRRAEARGFHGRRFGA